MLPLLINHDYSFMIIHAKLFIQTIGQILAVDGDLKIIEVDVGVECGWRLGLEQDHDLATFAGDNRMDKFAPCAPAVAIDKGGGIAG